MTMQSSRVVVVGSINIDETEVVQELPDPGETVRSLQSFTGLGGKGANQAAAAAAAGAEASLIGTVGGDSSGSFALIRLRELGVDPTGVSVDALSRTGRARITIALDGENQIVVAGGANDSINEAVISRAFTPLGPDDIVVLQGELPQEINEYALALTSQRKLRTILNLAPFQELPVPFRHSDPLVVNEVESSQLWGAPVLNAAEADARSGELLQFAKSVVVTLGARGAILGTPAATSLIPAPSPSQVVDTTGAGDALVGVLAASLAQGYGLREAVTRAVQAASASVALAGPRRATPPSADGLDKRSVPPKR